MRGNAYLSRPVGSKGPFRLKERQIAIKSVVYIGQHEPTAHYASAAKKFIPAEELYVPRKQRQKRR
jgi:hypothetical protein